MFYSHYLFVIDSNFIYEPFQEVLNRSVFIALFRRTILRRIKCN